MKNIRIDQAEVTSAFIDDQGFLQVGSVIGRVGVQEYVIDGKIVRELRREDEVMKSASTFTRKPVTLNHPPTFVHAENADSFLKGMASDVIYQDGKLIDKQLSVTHQDAIDAAMTTHRQVSCAYLVNIVPESGVWIDNFGVQGEVGKEYAYDAIQTNIIGNHIALVERARAGEIASLKLDSEDESITIGVSEHKDNSFEVNSIENFMSNEVTKTHLVIDGLEYNTREQIITNVEALKQMVKADNSDLVKAQDSLKVVETERDELKGKLAAQDAKVAELETKVAELESNSKTDAAIGEEVRERVALWNLVKPHLDGIEVDYNLSTLEIKKLYLAKKLNNDSLNDANEDVIKGAWLYAQPSKEDGIKATDKTVEQAELLDNTKGTSENEDGRKSAVDTARAKFEERIKNARKNKKMQASA